MAACAESSLGSQLLHAVGQETLGLEPPLTMVPWLLFNEATSNQCSDGVSCDIMFIMQEFDMENYIDGMNDLPGLLCGKFLADSPNCQPGNVVDISHNIVTTAL